MTVSLTGNFLATARCLIFEDATGVVWTFNPVTNQLTATVSSSASANTAANLSGGGAGSVPYQTSSGVTTFLAPGSNGNLLTLSAGLPVWEAVPIWNQNTTGNAATATNVAYSGLTGSVPTWNQSTTGNAATATSLVGGAVTSAVSGVGVNVSAATGAVTFTVNQAFTPTWTGAHIFSGGAAGVNAVTVKGANNATGIALSVVGNFTGAGTASLVTISDTNNTNGVNIELTGNGTTTPSKFLRVNGGNLQVVNNAYSSILFALSDAGSATFASALGVNGNAPPAQSTGWGTPTGGAVVASYNITDAGGANSNTNKAVAQIISVLKAIGILGA